MSDEYGIDLSRRKMLLGIGTMGAAGAVAGLGTRDDRVVADSEALEGESLEAGELDLSVHYEFAADQGDGGSDRLARSTSTTVRSDVDGRTNGASVGYDLGDVAPGDGGSLEFGFAVVGGPAYLRMYGELTEPDEDGATEPGETTPVEEKGGATNEGRLADAVDATLRYCDGEGAPGDEIATGTLGEVVSTLRSGVPLDGDGDGAAADDRAPFDGGEDAAVPTDETGVRLEWAIDEGVGNEIQRDAVEFDLVFLAEQDRYDDGRGEP